MITPFLNGLWTRDSPGYPPHKDYMWIDPERGRIVSFVAYAEKKLVHFQLRNWFAVTSPGTARVSLKPDREWMEHGVRLEGDRLVWTVLGKDQAWKHLPPDQAPEWLEAQVAVAYLRMDELEKRSGVRDVPEGRTGAPPEP